MLKKRWLAALALTPGFVCLGLLVFTLLFPPEPGVTRGNFNRVRNGMTKAEVEQVLGPSASDAKLGEKNWVHPVIFS